MTNDTAKMLRAALRAARKEHDEALVKAGKSIDKARGKADKDFIRTVDRAGKVRDKALANAITGYLKALDPSRAACGEAKRRLDSAK